MATADDQIAAGGPSSEPPATHKEDTGSSTTSIAPWRVAVVEWYSGGPKPAFGAMRAAENNGVSQRQPGKPQHRVQALALTGFSEEEIFAAVPELSPVHVVEIMARIPGEAHSIIHAHVQGMTPVEIERSTGAKRPNTYHWLGRLNLRPNKRSRDELTARQRRQIVKAFTTGEPMAAIARRFNVSYDQVRYAVKVG